LGWGAKQQFSFIKKIKKDEKQNTTNLVVMLCFIL